MIDFKFSLLIWRSLFDLNSYFLYFLTTADALWLEIFGFCSFWVFIFRFIFHRFFFLNFHFLLYTPLLHNYLL